MRKTTAYLIRIPTTDPNGTLDDMIARCPVAVEQTAFRSGTAGLRFRIPTNDIAAMDTAREIAAGRPFVLSTGYGVHQRDVGSQQ